MIMQILICFLLASDSLLDYAGRMRISATGYNLLRRTWIEHLETFNPTLFKYGNEFWQMCKDLAVAGYIPGYVFSKP